MTESPDLRLAFPAHVDDAGILTPDDPAKWRATLLGRFRGKAVWIEIGRPKLKRSDQQNRYYWSCVVPIFSECSGYEKDEAHDLLKSKFLRVERVLPSGEIMERVRSTTELTVQEFTEYVERCVRFCDSQDWRMPPMDDAAVSL